MAKRNRTTEDHNDSSDQVHENQTATVEVEIPTTDGEIVMVEGNLAVAPQPAEENSSEAPKYNKAKLDGYTTKSDKIRYLASTGMKRGEIAKELGIIYQHVRNVLVTPLKSKNA